MPVLTLLKCRDAWFHHAYLPCLMWFTGFSDLHTVLTGLSDHCAQWCTSVDVCVSPH